MNISLVKGPLGAVIFAALLAVVIGDFIRHSPQQLGRRHRSVSIALVVAFAIVVLRFKFLA
jgi:hypothetical protein